MHKRCSICKKLRIPGSGSFFKMPRDERMRSKWREACPTQLLNHSILCEEHFSPCDIIKRFKCKSLMPNAVPYVQPLKENCMPEMNMVCYQYQPMQDNYNADYVCPTPLHELNLTSVEYFKNCPENVSVDVPMELPFDVPLTREECLGWLPVDVADEPAKKVEYANGETQTDRIILECTMQMENESLKAEIKKLQDEVKSLKSKVAKSDKIVTSLKTIFTEGQIKKMMSPGNVHWSWTDISNAICLHASGPRAYNHLYKKNYPLPHLSTLQRWCRKINVDEGFLHTSIQFLKHDGGLEGEDKICVLAFDEMKVEETFEYEAVGDFVRKPANYVQVVIVRGLKKSWKQPIFYDFDCKMSKDVLFNIIAQLNNAGYPVVAMVCDMGSTNRKLWRELGVTPDKPWFANPVKSDDKVFAFADAPHLLKLIRNHFVDSGFLWNGELLTSRTIIDLLSHTSKSDVSITYKLTQEHLSVKGVGRQKVKLAAQLFSNNTASAIRRGYSVGLDIYNAMETAECIQLVNDWFDVVNSTLNNYGYPGKQPYGIALSEQQDTLRRMNEFMTALRLPNKKNMQVFQKGVIITNTALEMLHEYVKEKYNMTYIVTNRLNQDVIEHFFGNMRSKGGLNDHPTPKSFRYRLRKYILARNTEQLRGTGNVGHDTTEWLNVSTVSLKAIEHVEPNLLDDDEPDVFDPTEVFDDIIMEDGDDGDILRDDALEYIAGYMIQKCNLEEYTSAEQTFTWVDQVSKGLGLLKKPSSYFVQKVKKLEFIFNELNKGEISHHKNIQQRLVDKSFAVDLQEDVKRFFFKCRTHFRVKHLNKRLKVQKAKQRLLGCAKMLKIKL